MNNLNDALAWGWCRGSWLRTALVYPTLIAAISDAVAPIARVPAVGVHRFWRDMGYVAGRRTFRFICIAPMRSTP